MKNDNAQDLLKQTKTVFICTFRLSQPREASEFLTTLFRRRFRRLDLGNTTGINRTLTSGYLR